jgi:hypothetical protein
MSENRWVVPGLATLEMAPSWCKRDVRTGQATSVDRSACLEVKVSELRRLAGCVVVNPRTGKRNAQRRPRELPEFRRLRDMGGLREGTGVVWVSGRYLEWLWEHRRPARELRGDWRGTRAGAMRPSGFVECPLGQEGAGGVAGAHGGAGAGGVSGGDSAAEAALPGEADGLTSAASGVRHPGAASGAGVNGGLTGLERVVAWQTGRVVKRGSEWKGHRRRVGRAGLPVERVRLGNVVSPNPNRAVVGEGFGAAEARAWGGGEKRLGLGEWWAQGVRLEQWRAPAGAVAPWRYYAVCVGVCAAVEVPKAGAAAGADPPPERVGFGGVGFGGAEWVGPAGLSRRGWGPAGPLRLGGPCRERATHLMMVLATEAELRDAAVAQAWLRGMPRSVRVRDGVRPGVERVIERYGMLFTPRVLVCRACLGLRYGAHPDLARPWGTRKNRYPARKGR